jgi:hypothetical protein
MRDKTLKMIRELMARPPERLAALMGRLDGCQDVSQWERMHVELSREFGREMFERRLEEADSPPARCPHCQAEKDSAPLGAEPKGVSPPKASSRRGGG